MINKNKFNLSLLGESTVGKTSILEILSGGQFHENMVATIGVDYITTQAVVEGENYDFKIYDTVGQERYRSMAKRTIKISDGFILVFDVSKPQTFDLIKNWIDNIDEEVDKKTKILYLIGNKIDMKEEMDKLIVETAQQLVEDNKMEVRIETIEEAKKILEENEVKVIVTTEEAQKFAEENNMKYFETSAKKNIGIKNTFDNIYKDLVYLKFEIEKKEKEEKEEKKKKKKSKIKEENKENNEMDKDIQNNDNKENEDIQKNGKNDSIQDAKRNSFQIGQVNKKNEKEHKNWFKRHC